MCWCAWAWPRDSSPFVLQSRPCQDLALGPCSWPVQSWAGNILALPPCVLCCLHHCRRAAWDAVPCVCRSFEVCKFFFVTAQPVRASKLICKSSTAGAAKSRCAVSCVPSLIRSHLHGCVVGCALCGCTAPAAESHSACCCITNTLRGICAAMQVHPCKVCKAFHARGVVVFSRSSAAGSRFSATAALLARHT